MVDRPIIFSGPMVNALLAGRKSQTRRLLNPQPDQASDPSGEGQWGMLNRHEYWMPAAEFRPYAPGDRLYVREAFSYETLDVDRNGFMPPWYWADGNPASGDFSRPKPSIHMPRWASRITLTVTDVMVQRLQEITGRDIIAEGVRCEGCHDVGTGNYSACRDGGCFSVRNDFRDLWNSLHGPDAWDANPWVVAVSFTVQRGNIDQIGGAK